VPVPSAWNDLALMQTGDGVILRVRVTPRAVRNAFEGLADGALRVRLAAPPVEGAANRALLAFLADALGVPKGSLEIARGERGRQKLVRVRGLTAEEVHRRLAPALRAGG
jgi:uncharacterized protein